MKHYIKLTIVCGAFFVFMRIIENTFYTNHTAQIQEFNYYNPEDVKANYVVIPGAEILTIPAAETLWELNTTALTSLYHRYTNTYQILCRNQLRVGKVYDGGKEVCIDKTIAPKKPCLVYSFGSNNVFSFESDVIRLFGCDVHTFDPSMVSVDEEKIRTPPGCTFHHTGLGGEDTVTAINWTLKTLGTTMNELQHRKMDNDGYESDSRDSHTGSRVQDIDNGEIDATTVEQHAPNGAIAFIDGIEEPKTNHVESVQNSDHQRTQSDVEILDHVTTKDSRRHLVTFSTVERERDADQTRTSIVISATDLLKHGNNLKGKDGDEEDTLIGAPPRRTASARFSVQRFVLDQKQFDENYNAGPRPAPTLIEKVRKQVSKCNVSGPCVKKFIFSMFPCIQILRNYNFKTDIMGDVVSGLTVGIMHIPQGMAYGMLTTLPPVFGLYMSFFPVLIYFLFGSSKHISIGTFAVATLMIGSAVNKGYLKAVDEQTAAAAATVPGNLSENGTASSPLMEETDAMSSWELDIRLQYAMSMTFMVGIVQLIMGIFRLGFITVYLSDPLIAGFTTGAACHVFTSQIKHVFGIKTGRYSGAFKLIYTYRDFFTNILDTNGVTVGISVVCMVLLFCTGKFINRNPKLKPKMIMPVPIELIVVVLGTVISYAAKLEEKHNVVVVSDIPTGLPVPNANCVTRIPEVISDAIALAIVIFAISISMAKILAKKHNYEVDANQELLAFGLSAVFSSFFSAPAPSASLSRSLVQEGVGGKTQITGLISCTLLLVVLLAIGPYFRTLPNCILAATIIVALRGLFNQVFELPGLWRSSKDEFCVLASIIIIALRGMFLQILDLPKLWKVSVIDFLVWIVAFLGTVLLDVDLGLGVAVIFAILTVVVRSQRPYSCLLGQMPDTDIYRDINVYKEARQVEGLKIFRFENSLFFVNTEHFRTYLYKRTVNPRKVNITRKKKGVKEEKRKRKRETRVLGELQPNISIPDATEDMEINFNGKENDLTVVLTDISLPESSNDVEIDLNAIEKEVKAINEVKAMNEMNVVNAAQVESDAQMSVMESEYYEEVNPIQSDVGFHTIILDCSSWNFIDSMAVKVLSAIIGEYKAIGVDISLANCKTGIREMFFKTNFYNTLENSRIFVSVHDAVLHAQTGEIQNYGNGDYIVCGVESVDEASA